MNVIDNMLTQMVSLFFSFLGFLVLFSSLCFESFTWINKVSLNILILPFHSQFAQDPSFKPQGGRLGENDMDYDTDEKSMATLRRHLRRAREEYYRCKR